MRPNNNNVVTRCDSIHWTTFSDIMTALTQFFSVISKKIRSMTEKVNPGPRFNFLHPRSHQQQCSTETNDCAIELVYVGHPWAISKEKLMEIVSL